VRIRVSGIPAGVVHPGVVDLPNGSTVGRLLEHLECTGMVSQAPWGPEMAGSCAVFLNGRNIASLDGQETRLRENDEVLLVIPAAGG
jgi:molybdopterin converting factor small subunit